MQLQLLSNGQCAIWNKGRGKCMAFLEFNFESQYLGNNHTVGIILPDKPRDVSPVKFYGSGKKYKVLWLLHGTYGDWSDWLRKSNIELYACEQDLAVVMPSALNSNYSNWPGFATGFNMYDYLIDELMPLIYNWFPISDKREDNFIAGLSMGGGGAIKYAVNYPEKFAAAAILSSSPREIDTYILDQLTPRERNNVANAGGLAEYQNSYENTWRLLKEEAASGRLPRLYFCIGEDDGGYERFIKFRSYAQSIGLNALFETEPGYKHEWRFWDKYIQRALSFFGLDVNNAGNPF